MQSLKKHRYLNANTITTQSLTRKKQKRTNIATRYPKFKLAIPNLIKIMLADVSVLNELAIGVNVSMRKR